MAARPLTIKAPKVPRASKTPESPDYESLAAEFTRLRDQFAPLDKGGLASGLSPFRPINALRAASPGPASPLGKRFREPLPRFDVGIEKGQGSKVSGQIQKLAADMAAKGYGWSGREWNALVELLDRESDWDPRAQNPSSTAFGLFQFLDKTWAGTGVAKTSDPYQQIVAGLRYIRNRYGSPSAALAFHNRNNWY